jgi:HlyD family secretion protein
VTGFFDTLGAARGASVPLPRRSWKTRVALPAAILLASVGLLGGAAWNAFAPATDVVGVPVVLAAATMASVAGDAAQGSTSAPATSSATVQAAGWMEPSPYPIFATALAEGVIDEILVLEGDRVTKGQPIARLVAADAIIAAEKSKAELARAQASVDAANATLANVIGLDRAVKVAEAKLAGTIAAFGQLDADIAAAQAMLNELEDELARKRTLVERGAASAIEVSRLGFRIDSQRAAVAALVPKRTMLEATRAEAEAERDAAVRSRELLIEERSALAIAESELALATANRREAELRVERSTITSPADGVVLARLVSPGMMVSPSAASIEGGRVVSLYDPKHLQVRADVPNADIALVGVGQAVEIKVEALPNAAIRGEVLRITSQADIAKNTVQVKIRIIDPPSELRPEMLCRVRIHAGMATGGGGASNGATTAGATTSARQRIFAPKALVGDGHVLVAGALRDGLGRAERRTVEVGREERGAWIEIVSGLRPGDVLIDPAVAHEGSRIRVTTERAVDGDAKGGAA